MYHIFYKQIISEDKSDEFINKGNNLGFEKASVNVYGEHKLLNNIRNNSRVQWEDSVLASYLEHLLLNNIHDFPYLYKNKTYKKVGQNFRMYKYIPQEYFKPHKDGHNIDKSFESLITVLFYLNTPIGGETILMPNGYKDSNSWISIKPEKGAVLLFDHDYWHEGKPVLEGNKFVLRTDLYYS